MASKSTWLTLAIIIVVAGGLIALAAWPQHTAAPSSADLNIKSGPAPWPADQDHLAARLQAMDFPQLSSEGTVLHIHQHLDIFVHGKPVAVPAEIGIGPGDSFITILHTHDATGVIHVESPQKADYTLGQFMQVWGVRFDTTHLGGYTQDAENKLQVYANGQPVQGDPRNLKLTEHEEIVIVYGTAQEQPQIPSSYAFAQGL